MTQLEGEQHLRQTLTTGFPRSQRKEEVVGHVSPTDDGYILSSKIRFYRI
jgi:hypothetical protein